MGESGSNRNVDLQHGGILLPVAHVGDTRTGNSSRRRQCFTWAARIMFACDASLLNIAPL